MKKLFVVLIGLILICILYACSRMQYVPVQSIQTDSIYIYRHTRDSIYHRDSIYVLQRNDTVYINKYKYLFVDKAVHDTLYIERTDTIRVPYPVEKKLSTWQQIKMDIAGIGLVALIISIAIIIIRWIQHTGRK